MEALEVSGGKGSTVLTFVGGAKASVEEVLERAEGVYLVIKDSESRIVWCNQNFAQLVGQSKVQILGSVDPREEHVAHDKAVLKDGRPILNLHESIVDAQGRDVAIVTQKGALRVADGEDHRFLGITVCFARDDIQKDANYWTKRLALSSNPLGGQWAPVGLGPSPVDGTPTYSTNYFMLTESETLQLHRLAQDEQWFFHAGHAIRLHMFHLTPNDSLEKPSYESVLVGGDQGLLQYSVPAGCWFGADLPDRGFSLSSCSLAPGWTPTSSTNPDNHDLERLLVAFSSQPEVVQIIKKLSSMLQSE